MQLLSWLHKQMTARPHTRRAPAHGPTPRFRPRLEALEGRDVPSTLTVTSTADSGAGTLRAEIAAANSGDTIVFAPSLDGQRIELTSGVLDINKSLTIQGPGAGRLAVNVANRNSAVFKVEPNVQGLLSGLTIAGGYGGGIYNVGTLTVSDCNIAQNDGTFGGGICNAGTLTLTDSTLSGNYCLSYGTGLGGNGGGIYNSGTLTASGCTLYDNQAALNGGGVYTTGRGTATLTDCTLSNNSAFGSTADGHLAGGGGVFVGFRSTANLTNCTLSLNAAKYGDGGGIYVTRGVGAGTLNLTNTIVAGNTVAGYPGGPDIYRAVTTADHNLVGDGSGSSGVVNGVNGNTVGTPANPIDPRLGPLQNNGGPTQTMALLAGSPAIGHANNAAAPATDQRGVARLDAAGETTDIGAFEL
jgi:parallel beta-helix repeat protein